MTPSTQSAFDSLDTMVGGIADHEVLNREEERALFEKLSAGDTAAREQLMRQNMRFVIKLARQYRGHGISLHDLVQEGVIGLLQAIDRFDWTKGFRFSTYAAYYIRQEIQAALHRQLGMIRLPVRKARMLGKINETSRRFTELEGREPSAQEIGLLLDIPAGDVEMLLGMRHSFCSMEAERGDDGHNYSDTLVGDDGMAVRDSLDHEQSADVLREALEFLTPREREVLRLRYGLNKSGRALSLRKASAHVGLSQEGVRRVESRALAKLRRPALRARLEGLLGA